MNGTRQAAYDVVLPVSRRNEALAQTTLLSLREHLDRPEAIRTVEIVEVGQPADDAWESVLEHLRAHPDRDLLVVAPGILAAPLLDLRLQWSAYAADRVAIVSPLCDLDPATSVARHGLQGVTAAAVDRRIAGGWAGAVVDAPYPLPECAFLRSGLIVPHLAGIGTLKELIPALREEGLLFAFAPHIFVGHVEHDGLEPRSQPWLDEAPPQAFLADTPVHRVAERLLAAGKEESTEPSVRHRSRPRILHVSHSLGGGLERWVELFTSASPQVGNFVLKSIGERGRFGSQLWLYEGSRPLTPLQTWKLAPPIRSTVAAHLGYRAALEEIIDQLGIDAVVVSSLIGHSLDVLRTAVRTAVVLHDYYPFCPALHIFFDGVCTECGAGRLAECIQNNPFNNLFETRSAREWIVLREAFLDSLSTGGVQAIAPSDSVVRHLRQLAPHKAFDVKVIGHGSDARDVWREPEMEADAAGPLRIVVLGHVTPAKGKDLLRDVIERSADLARFWLVGCGEAGRRLAGKGVEVLERYERHELPGILARISPDLGLLLSIVPETFSFTLDECLGARIPPVAVRVGSFVDRIEDGVNGFLCAPDAASVAARLEELAADRGLLARTRDELGRRPVRPASDMAADYVRVLGLHDTSPRAYFAREWDGWSVGGLPLPAGSPLGFSEFLRQVETGTLHHIRQTRRLRGWRQAVASRTAAAGFRAMRLLMRWLAG